MIAIEDQARSIFLASLERPPDHWAAFLDEACGDHVALRARVDQLLQAHQAMGSIHGGVPDRQDATRDQPISERPGTVIGPYKLLQQIGEGGMGVVWMAEQTEPVKRKVALKVIKSGMDSRQVIARFEAERQALALMDHVNIARVFDGGTTGEPSGVNRRVEPADDTRRLTPLGSPGRPYFVMELVHGVSITKYCDDNHLTPRERLELFVPVCHAIQHAHQKGIIHRDIKPSNVMVTLYDGKPVPKVIDFGVAKATEQKLTERTLFTQYGTMVGTLEYMSPEQAEMSALGVDTRSDIYSLGVLLYELLTGSTPLTHKRMKEAAYAEILRMIKEEEPPKPSTRLSDSGEALASISAQRHTEPAKLTKLVKGELDWIVMKTLEKDRNRRYETANAFAADVQRYLGDEPVLACPPSAGYRFRKFVRRNKRALTTAAVLAVAVLVVAGIFGWAVRDRESKAQEVARDRATRQAAVEQEVNQALKEAEQLQEQAKWLEALSAAKRAEGILAGGGSDDLRDRVQQLRKDLALIVHVEEIPLLSSEWKADRFDSEAADRAYEQAFRDFGIDLTGMQMEEAAARIRARAGVAASLSAALDAWASLACRKDTTGGVALRALAEAADLDPWRRQVRQAVRQKDAKALAKLAASPELLRQPPTSQLALAWALHTRGLEEASIDVLRQAQRQHPGDFWINFNLASTLEKFGSTYRDEVIAFLRAALAVRPRSVKTHTNLGLALMDRGKLDEAIAVHSKAIELDPNYADAHLDLGIALCDHKKDYEGALTAFKQALRLKPNFPEARANVGLAVLRMGRTDEAIVHFKEALDGAPKFFGADGAHNGLGNAYMKKGRVDQAIDCYRMGIELAPKNAIIRYNLGIALAGQNKLGEAITSYREAIKLDPEHFQFHINLGNALVTQEKLDQAIACYREAARLVPKNPLAHTNLGKALRLRGKADEALASFHKALDVDPKYASAHFELGDLLGEGKRDFHAAIKSFREAIRLKPHYAEAHYGVGLALSRKGLHEQALVAFREAIRLKPDFAVAHSNLGLELQEKGLVDEAIAAFREAIRLKPEFVLAHFFLGNALEKKGLPDGAIAAFREAVRIDPKFAHSWYRCAWLLATHPNPERRDPAQALQMAKKAVELMPSYGGSWQSLAWAQYRAGDWKTAIIAMEKVKELGSAGDSREWFLLAMAHWKLGKKDEARKWYDQAVAWMERNEPRSEELRRFQVEAETLLEIKKQ